MARMRDAHAAGATLASALPFLFSPAGRIRRLPFFASAAVALLIKIVVDALACSLLQIPWVPWMYLHPIGWLSQEGNSQSSLWFLLWSLPFGWFGLMLFLRRLRDAGMPLWIAAGFFLPWCNLLLFTLLCLVPTETGEGANRNKFEQAGPLAMPTRKPGQAAVAVLAPAAVALALIGITVHWLSVYGTVLFVATPFLQGFLVGWLAAPSPKPPLGTSGLSALVVALGLLLNAWEGMVCLAMASPLWLLMQFLGTSAGDSFAPRVPIRRHRQAVPPTLLLMAATLASIESVTRPSSTTYEATTEVIVAAPREVVWQHLVAFSELAPPDELVFRAGIAYPIRASIEGHGPGAIRRCSFSTGDFIEPITVWDEPRLLRFSVEACPEPMREWNPFHDDVEAAHLHQYFVAEQGQFALHELPDGTTLLAGTTWYRHGLWPEWYWSLWSQSIVHTIHRRVLQHIRDEAEKAHR